MTGPEHFREAERLLESAVSGNNVNSEHEDRLTAAALVHATLALTAANALTEPVKEWAEVCGVPPAGGASDG